MMGRCVVVAMLAALMPALLPAQGYRVRLDTRLQSVAFRGVQLDSIPASDAVMGPSGGFLTPDGIAAQCFSGLAFCTFFRPGPERQGGPLVTTADVAVWGLGIPGLTVRGKLRIGADLGDVDTWPGTDPAVQLLEGYAEYASRYVTAQLGRTHVVSRFGFTGFDGARVEVRPLPSLRVLGYGGWGLARGIALPVTSDALNPLDDFQPRDRQLVVGTRLGWSAGPVEASVLYQREVDPAVDLFVTERVAFEGALNALRGLTIAGGADYDLSFDYWGTAEARVGWVHPRALVHVTAGGRRYRPHFDLWTIWGAFSPTPYRALFGSAAVRPIDGVEVRARGEVYRFDDSEAQTGLARFEDDGWRWAWGATVSRFDPWTVFGEYHADFGPGAASLGFEGGVSVQPIEEFAATALVGTLQRPLEFRFDDAKVWTYGFRVDYQPHAAVGLLLEVHRYDEVRRRPDAARLDWDQVRVNAGVRFVFGSGGSEGGLHPAILRIPDVPRTR